jgi:hypothetical protein
MPVSHIVAELLLVIEGNREKRRKVDEGSETKGNELSESESY